MRSLLLAASLIVLLSACAANRASNAEELALAKSLAEAPVSGFNFTRLQGWQALGDSHLIVQVAQKRAYLLTLSHPCRELDYQLQIGLSSFGSRVQAGFEYVLVPDDIGSHADQTRCRIHKIQPIAVKALDQARADLRKK
jgi:Family of unknown function (DUF6491)